jgi:hypothetical protein
MLARRPASRVEARRVRGPTCRRGGGLADHDVASAAGAAAMPRIGRQPAMRLRPVAARDGKAGIDAGQHAGGKPGGDLRSGS